MSDLPEYPLVTFALFAYNQEKYIREAVEGALAQDYPNLEIIISDDCSQDETWKLIQKMAAAYSGPHKVVLNKNEINLGICGHVNKIADLASGGLVVMAAGDDVSYPGRTSTLVREWISSGMGDAILHSDSRIVEDFIPTSSIAKPNEKRGEYLTVAGYVFGGMNHPIRGQSAAYTAQLFRAFGFLDVSGAIEDQPLFFRALLLGAKVIYVEDVMLDYRVTGQNVCMGYTRSDRERTIRWMQARANSIYQQIKDYKASGLVDASILNAMKSEASRLERCVGLASNNPYRLVLGVMAYTQGRNISDRVFMMFRYFGMLDGRIHNFLRNLKWTSN